jgi:hypothetical protein
MGLPHLLCDRLEALKSSFTSLDVINQIRNEKQAYRFSGNTFRFGAFCSRFPTPGNEEFVELLLRWIRGDAPISSGIHTDDPKQISLARQ